MATSLSTRQGLLTKTAGRLTLLLDDVTNEVAIELPLDETMRKTYVQDKKLRLTKLKKNVQAASNNVDNALRAYTEAADALDSDTAQLSAILEKVSTNSSMAQDLLLRAQASVSEIDTTVEDLSATPTAPQQDEATPIQLAPLPIPKFSGHVWEWESFWNAFDFSVHSRNIGDIHKMAYLVEALQGDARRAIKQFQVSSSTYAMAIDHLKKKFGNPQLLLNELAGRLERCRARSLRIEDQKILYEEVSSVINQMTLKGESVDNVLLQKQVLSKFNESIQRHVLKKKREEADHWTTAILLSHVCNFIDTEVEIRRHVEIDKEGRESKQRKSGTPTWKKSTNSWVDERKSFTCFFCEKNGHSPRDCPEYTTREQRLDHMRRNSLCLNCGDRNHKASECSRGACRICHKIGHHTSICRQMTPSQEKEEQSRTERKQSTTTKTQKHPPRKATRQNFVSSTSAQDIKHDTEDDDVKAVLCMKSTGTNSKDCVLVGEAQVFNPLSHTLETVHILLDTGADRSFISEDLAERLQLKNIDTVRMSINTFGGKQPKETECGITTLQIFDGRGKPHWFKVARIEYLTENLKQSLLSKEDKRYLAENDIQLSVSHKFTQVRPQVLLGCNDAFSLIDDKDGKMKLLPSGLRLIPSLLGHLVIGRVDEQTHANVLTSSSTTQEDEKWEEFLALQSSGIQEFAGSKVKEQEQVNKMVWSSFESTIERHDDGYHVRLPWKEDAESLPDNKSIAFKRLCSNLSKLRNTSEILQKYHQTFREQLDKGIIEEVDDHQPANGNTAHYLSHQAVITPTKEYTKLRIVFDASAHFKDKPSLNDVLHQGPVILPVMRDMLIRFRLGHIAMIADVEKAFLQIHLNVKDRDATRCLWVQDPSRPPEGSNLVTYRFTRITFGLNCSPFLLAGTIKYHLQKHTRYGNLANELHDNVYVDNVILTSSNTEEALKKYKTSKAIFTEMNMNLRGYLNNDDMTNKAIPTSDKSSQLITKVLGLVWDSTKDTMMVEIKFAEKRETTKRTISEQIASIYDPMGWLSPLLVRGKLFLQSLWKAGYEWDTKLSNGHEQDWKALVAQVNGYQQIFRRQISPLHSDVKLVVFADASTQAMAACAYLVAGAAPHLVFARTKLANVKDQMTIPKMEMHALTLATRLAYTVQTALAQRINVNSITILTDSEIALSWLSTYPIKKEVSRFVKRRIMEIRAIIENTDACTRFGYVNTNENPADSATRGLTAVEARDHIWWTGPQFLVQPAQDWSKEHRLFILPQDEDAELDRSTAQKVLLTTSADSNCDGETELLLWSRHNTLTTAQAAVAYAMRFIRNICSRISEPLALRIKEKIPELENCRVTTVLSAVERRAALRVIIRNHQRIHVTDQLKRSVKDLNLQPDQHGILRCRGRLNLAHIPELAKNPIFVAAKTPLAFCIINDAHSPLHQGTSHTMATVRNKYWIPKLRHQVQAVLRKCVPCQQMNALPFQYPAMGPLPERRVVKTKPFENVGIDYFGPLTTKKKDEHNKIYGLIITCMTTRLIHIEVVTDMSTERLMLALRRVFARRGVPRTITSDNGPSFILADQILKDVILSITNDKAFQNTIARRGIEWTTIPPYAPWQGAFYERLIKSIKHSLFKTIGSRILTEEELTTLLYEIEGSLNTRPLTYQDSEYEQLTPLRPIDFLVKDIEVTYPFGASQLHSDDPDYVPPEELSRIQTRKRALEALASTQKLSEKFWSVWQKIYLSSLRETHKLHMDNKRSGSRTPKEGMVVLLADPNIPRNAWKVGRITALKTGTDNAVREVELRMPNGHVLKRPVNLLVPLELQDEEQQLPRQTAVKEDQHNGLLPSDSPPQHETQHRYNLRKRPHRISNEDQRRCTRSTVTSSIHTTIMCTLTLFCLFGTTMESSTSSTSIRCVNGGVHINNQKQERYEICTEGYCILRHEPPLNETLYFPPEITHRDHAVQWKILDGTRLNILEISCPAIPFCENVQCWFCTANMFNPECNPTAALLSWMAVAYLLVAILYTICYVPLTIGKPFRVMGNFIILCLSLLLNIWRCLKRIFYRRRLQRFGRANNIDEFLRLPLIAVTFAITIATASACQEVDMFTMQTNVCSKHPHNKGKCFVEHTEVLKLNTFNQEACLRVVNKNVIVYQHKIIWKGLHLNCTKQSLMFTRNTNQKVIDAKRCAHSGSCTGLKCENVSTTDEIPELAQGNKSPGITRCIESCGGPGCGCFYLSSGCLFYRVYHVPTDENIYEIFRGQTWKETVELEIQSEHNNGTRTVSTIFLQPSAPKRHDQMRITVSLLAVPPMPILQTAFISNGNDIAIWNKGTSLPMQCASLKRARQLECEVSHTCNCQPAENRIRCNCADFNITSVFYDEIEKRLPVRRPWISFEADRGTNVIANIHTLVTAELLLTLKGDVTATVKEVTDTTCKISNTIAQGCYQCIQGAVANVTCTSSDQSTRAVIRCDDRHFTVPCTLQGTTSRIRFTHTKARLKMRCRVTCGTKETSFEITGILQWVRTIQETVRRIIDGESTINDEFVFPDIAHIADTIFSGYKMLIIAAVSFATAIALGYAFFWTCGVRVFVAICRLLLLALRVIVLAVLKVLLWPTISFTRGVLFRPLTAKRGHVKQL